MSNQLNTGYVKLYRNILQQEWYADINAFRLYLCLLLEAQWEDKTVNSIFVPRGSLLTSIRSLSAKTSLPVQQLRTAIEKLKAAGEITVSPTNRYSLIRLTNWDKYQCGENAQQSDPRESRNAKSTHACRGTAKEKEQSYDIDEYERRSRSTVPIYHKKQKP